MANRMYYVCAIVILTLLAIFYVWNQSGTSRVSVPQLPQPNVVLPNQATGGGTGTMSLKDGRVTGVASKSTVQPPPFLVLISQGRVDDDAEKLENKSTVQPPPLPEEFVPLSNQKVDGVKKFVFFIGWGATGSSIIGSVMDAHPHMIIPHEYGLFEKWAADSNRYYLKKSYLFNELYRRSYNNAFHGLRNSLEPDTKGYTFNLDGLWQGQFQDSIAVIGDKKAGPTPGVYLKDPATFKKVYHQLAETVQCPILVIFAARNPYDIVSKRVVRQLTPTTDMRKLQKSHHIYENNSNIEFYSNAVLELAGVNHAMMNDPELNMTVLEVHNADYVKYPRKTVQRICDFVGVECSEQYLQMCEDKAFTETFKTRELVKWPQELKSRMEQGMRKYRFFDRYSFDSE